MAFARWIERLGAGRPLPLHAAPGSARDFTYVDDAAAGILAALRRGRSGEAYNVSGWHSVDLGAALTALEQVFGRRASLETTPPSASEARITHGCGRKSALELGYEPRTDLAAGLRGQLAAAIPGRLAA